ncbi:aldo/keto reductase [Niameybacter massiliensis]|uniref:Aldo/keto reductase n=1 Tax=Holtiella tumoricola TaxID=3018743 RepID=A0AA42DQL0_9FIRM|nr:MULTISPECIES: aldo/keto reductase [Lachnospirales]MDA3733071.1 aldo/keto reductase [Holtiella tumoricola]
MKSIKLGTSSLHGSEISLGCMRMAGHTVEEVRTLIETAHEVGIDFYDHADIYGQGESESLFGKALKETSIKREDLVIQTKCGIRPGFFDFSKEHILSSVDKSLQRLGMDYVDVLLLHRPDTLMEPEEVAEAFRTLRESGKVRHFGVSNQNPMQMALLNRYLDEKIIINQLQLSITNTTMMDAGLNVNMENAAAVNRDGSVLDYCRLEDITIQAWSPFQYGFFEGVFLDNPKFPELNQVIDRIAAEKGITNSALAVAWILRHPARIQTIVGTTNHERLKAIAKGTEIELTRQEWYEIYRAAGNILP